MEAPKPTPLWLHIVRLLVLVAAAAGVAWLVASVQRRAMQARALKSDPAPAIEPEFAVASGELEFDALPASVGFDSIEVPIALSSAIEVRLEPPELAGPRVPEVDAELPELTLEVGKGVPPSLPWVPHIPMADPYIGSSKSMVFRPGTLAPTDPKPRHGKP
jgi:hypothetical protein